MFRFTSAWGLVLWVGCSPSAQMRHDASTPFDGGTDAQVERDASVAADAGGNFDARTSSCAMDDECDDGLFCNGAESCVEGQCTAGAAPDCDDAIACTADVCDEAMGACRSFADMGRCAEGETCGPAGCSSECSGDEQCDDGVFCNGSELCLDGACAAGTALDCDDSIPCTQDICDELTSACHSFPTDMGCGAGETCNAESGCIPECASNAECDDGFFCNGAERCDEGACVPGTLPDCDDGVTCTRDICDESSDSCLVFAEDSACALGETCEAATGCTPDCISNSDCDDGQYCTGSERCVGGQCVAGTPIACNDGVACTIDVCDESADVCRAVPEDTRCSGNETCSAGMGCIPACSNSSQCDDGFFCTGTEACIGGSCVAGVAPPADDGVACTIEFCSEAMTLASSVPTHSLCAGAGGVCEPAPACTTIAGCVGSDSAGHETFSSAVDAGGCAHSFVDISTTGTRYGPGDDTTHTIALGGSGFEFYGVPMSSVRVDSNGHISSDLTTSSDLTNGCGLGGGLSGSGVRVLVYHDDLVVNEIYHRYFATCPRAHDFAGPRGCNVIQWDAYHFGAASTDNWMMQAVLYEGSEDMAFVYSGDTRENGSGATVGYVNGPRSVGVEWGCDSEGAVVNDSTLCTYAATSCP